MRVIGGTVQQIPKWQKQNLKTRRDPTPKNGAAKDLFASDLLAVKDNVLSHAHEETEKMLLMVGERLSLRGPEIDRLNNESMKKQRKEIVKKGLDDLKKNMTLTVVDGNFPREVLANQNLKFASYKMPARRNSSEFYNSIQHAPVKKQPGVITFEKVSLNDPLPKEMKVAARSKSAAGLFPLWGVISLSCCLIGLAWFRASRKVLPVLIIALMMSSSAQADPCGMVPPIYVGDQIPIARVGLQQTYVFYKDGLETVVIRPGFKGDVDEFGMLIPFPSVPSLRKVSDNIFPHLDAAIDPPEVVIDLRYYALGKNRSLFSRSSRQKNKGLKYDVMDEKKVRVIKQEAVGMYEVTVLEAGSAKALKLWMDDHDYVYPKGMDGACEDYVKLGWCFVAVKTKVSQKKGVDPKPGMRKVNPRLPDKSSFDGHVQAMGFRFKVDKMVVPMRLSTFNEGDLRNVVYILSDEPMKIRSIPEEYVVRQIPGSDLFRNVTGPLPLRVIGGTVAQIPQWQKKNLKTQRDPIPKNGAAKDLFASDLLAVKDNVLSHAHEETEKMLLMVGERLSLRGPEIDKLNNESMKVEREQIVKKGLDDLKKNMTLTVVDGNFPREVLANQNLKFASYQMPARRNSSEFYNTLQHAPVKKQPGIITLEKVSMSNPVPEEIPVKDRKQQGISSSPFSWGIVSLSCCLIGLVWFRASRKVLPVLIIALMMSSSAQADPCGMVPPIYVGDQIPIARIGLQQTYVFYKDGLETVVIRPGFKGKVEEFGMLIPFPSVPSLRKVSDNIFPHLDAAIDPPEVVIDLRVVFFGGVRGRSLSRPTSSVTRLAINMPEEKVRVIKQEAVGMYEVTVLEAGSAKALKLWMDDHDYVYPKGMDGACEDYVKLGWCFVAVKTKVAGKKGVDPKPGMRKVNARLPDKSSFDGHVQAMGFRFKVDEMVVPMRLSTFNEGDLRNVVYILSDEPMKIQSIPEEYVVRQIPGSDLFRNVTGPLPLRVIGGTVNQIPDWQKKNLKTRRDPTPKNGAAKDLFASDLLAVKDDVLSHAHEETEKMLLMVGERLSLRGPEIDKLNNDSMIQQREEIVKKGLDDLKKNMTLTVVDGNFPREVLANQNLKFASYQMPARRNSSEFYNTIQHAPVKKQPGIITLEKVSMSNPVSEEIPSRSQKSKTSFSLFSWGIVSLSCCLIGLVWFRASRKVLPVLIIALMMSSSAQADPCGMVPPIYVGDQIPIARIGLQQTYVFYKDGLETVVIRPGFKGNVDEFGMLIPFPSVPSLRKVSDNIFPHLDAAIDPPEVVVDLRIIFSRLNSFAGAVPANQTSASPALHYAQKDIVRVIKQEAVGMYEVTVLEAGSARALKLWMDDHDYVYPKGMDGACEDYVKLGWCFVAVKTKVSQKKGVDPKPGMRKVNPKLPDKSSFDGHVQAMGFRFKVDEMVVPMRLSTFNEGDLRNVVYILSDEPMKIQSIPEEYVVRQIPGSDLFRNVTGPLPLRVIGGTVAQIPQWQKKNLKTQRDPTPKNGAAKELFAADLLAVKEDVLSHAHEETEKMLLMVGERLSLRGPEIDKLNNESMKNQREEIVKQGLDELKKKMTLTVIDGNFPREILSKQNLKFARYKMPARRNSSEFYNTLQHAPGRKQPGIIIFEEVSLNDPLPNETNVASRSESSMEQFLLWGVMSLSCCVVGLLLFHRVRKTALMLLIIVMATSSAQADPCGMVPPIYVDDQIPIARIGLQQTYVFYKDGLETVVIRPGFKGNVDEFGMLIPFPTVPSLRKVSDNIFPHLDAAVDPPEVVIDLRHRYLPGLALGGALPVNQSKPGQSFQYAAKDVVRVVKQEAVGMYEVTVLEAGSAKALKLWMDDHDYVYPKGMDGACEDYVKLGWCFVAVKTKVSQKKGVDPKPGMRKVNPKLPDKSSFDGHVQAMGFRFKVDDMVVPMRLSTFNEGDLRNVVYILSDEPLKIQSIPEEYVVRQIPGSDLFRNVTGSLPLRVIGGTVNQIPDWQKKNLKAQRNPTPKNGAAKDLFASDLLAVKDDVLSHAHEETEKMLLMVGERLSLRGPEIDKLNNESMIQQREEIVKKGLDDLKQKMTMTVVDGNFPREILSKQNLKFAGYTMPARRNSSEFYNSLQHAPVKKQPGIITLEKVSMSNPVSEEIPFKSRKAKTSFSLFSWGIVSLSCCLIGLVWFRASRKVLPVLIIALMMSSSAQADPCGMVPPIYVGDQIPIARIGLQQTYVFYKDGLETVVIRPGFKGNVDEFGMLIPFPSVPSLRKVSDNIFPHLDAAVDPPEVVIDLRFIGRRFNRLANGIAATRNDPSQSFRFAKKDAVRVIKQEAVGMYEVTVLEAGSAKALKLWMDDHDYVYPKGMDGACEDYVKLGWCFVAVKTKVSQKKGVDPKPGMRKVNPKLPDQSSFDGHVQAMGFRFKVDDMVVPMRLSTFNEGDLRNVVYILSDEPMKIQSIPEEYVVRQIPGSDLFRNVTGPLPLRVIGGTVAQIPQWQKKNLKTQRDPTPKNGAAKELFASDLLAVKEDVLSHAHEETEKMLLMVGERLSLRGPEIDKLNNESLIKEREEIAKRGLDELKKKMTLTVIDGNFPREILSQQNLKFASYKMPSRRNSSEFYNTIQHGPKQKQPGMITLEKVSMINSAPLNLEQPMKKTQTLSRNHFWSSLFLGSLFAGAIITLRKKRTALLLLLLAGFVLPNSFIFAEEPTNIQLIDQLGDPKKAEAAAEQLIKRGQKAIPDLIGEAFEGNDTTLRGWAIVCLSEIGGEKAAQRLLELQNDQKESMLVRTWAAAGRVHMTSSTDELLKLANLIPQFPALGRPVGLKLISKMNDSKEEVTAEKLLDISMKVPQLQKSLVPAIMAMGSDKLVSAMVTAKNQNIRRQAAAYLGTLANQGDKTVAKAVADAYKFDAKAKEVPWSGGPLFIPGLKWDKENSQALVHSLVGWHLWCDLKKQNAQQKQIHNNLRSLQLAAAAGYQSPGFQEVGTDRWLEIWKAAAGKEKLKEIFDALNVTDQARFKKFLEE